MSRVQDTSETRTGGGRDAASGGATVDNTGGGPPNPRTVGGVSTSAASRCLASPTRRKLETSTEQETTANCMPLIRETLQTTGISPDTCALITASWKPRTHKHYTTYIHKWELFCLEREADPLRSTLAQALQFLTELFPRGFNYNAVDTTRSALSATVAIKDVTEFGTHTLSQRLMRGIFNKRPKFPKYLQMWDVSIVLDYLGSLSPNSSLSLEDLTLKAAMLLALLTGQRCQILHHLETQFVRVQQDAVDIYVNQPLKQSKPARRQPDFELPRFADVSVCIVSVLQEYVNQLEKLREGDRFFMSYRRSHTGVSQDTISRWLRVVLI